jgi:hypothetical protein
MNFENYLAENGYIPFSLNAATGKYEDPLDRNVMNNLHTRWIHSSDQDAILSIKKGLSIYGEFSREMRKSEICFGFNQCHRPPTLIFPRPRMIRKDRFRNEIVTFNCEMEDDDMNLLLSEISFNEILQEIRDPQSIYEIDRTQKKPIIRKIQGNG